MDSIRPSLIYADRVSAEFPETNPDDPRWRLRILAEGDSWFSIGGTGNGNLLEELRFRLPAIVVNCGAPGDTIRNMSDLAGNPVLTRLLRPTTGFAWDAIFISGGGNDLIDAADMFIRDGVAVDDAAPIGDCIDETLLQAHLDRIAAALRTIAGLRDGAKPSPHTRARPLIFCHTYDFAEPRNSPARFLFTTQGPWLHRAMERSAVPPQRRRQLADHLLQRLKDTLTSLRHGAAAIEGFVVVDT